MTKKRFLAALVLLCFCAALLCAADFWQKKKYTEWTPQEVQKMMSDSPWAKQVEVTIGDPRGIGRTGGAGSTAGRSSGGGAASMGRDQVPRTSFLVRFHTALPIKQAIMRARFGEKVAQAPEAAQFIGRPESLYVISVTGSARFVPRNPADLKEAALLVVKGRTIQAANVEADPGQQENAVLFFFPRGDNPIKLDDDTLELQVKFATVEVKHKFKLKDLVFDGKLEM